jgi:hypothetical protein
VTYSKLIEEHLRFLEFDKSTVATLQDAQKPIEVAIDEPLDNCYGHILHQPELKRLFSDKKSAERARNARKRHWL